MARNRVTGHDGFGIGLVELNQYEPQNNEITGNVLADNNVDLLYQRLQPGDDDPRQLLLREHIRASSPDAIETSMPCPAATRRR